jgi:hypothetical protein
MIIHKPPEWMFFNHLTQSYDTQDGTKIGVEHYSSSYGINHWTQIPDASCRPTDALTLAIFRDKQRKAIKARGQA